MIKGSQKIRETSVELLRMVMAMGIVILHYNNPAMGGGLKYVEEGSLNFYFLLFEQNLFICAINVFILISGYYLCTTEKRSFIKVCDLIVQIIFFKIVYYLYTVVSSDTQITLRGVVNCFVPNNYYVILYSTLYLISPYINMVMKKLSKKELKKFIFLNILIFSAYTILVDYAAVISGLSLEGLSSVGIYGSSSGYTIINFMLVYIVGAYIKIGDVSFSKKRLWCGLVCLMCLMNVVTIVEHKLGIGYGTEWFYNNPVIIIIAANIFLLFKELKIQSRIINEFSKASFACVVFHITVFPYLDIKGTVEKSLLYLIKEQLVSVVAIYLVSYLMFKVYFLCSKKIIGSIKPVCNRLDSILLFKHN